MQRRMIVFSLAVALMLTACATFQNYGRFEINAEAEQAFKRCEVNPALRYYVSGPDYFPNALLGLHRDYQMAAGSFWREVKMTPGVMKATIEQMNTQAYRFRQFPDSYRLVDFQGRPVGVWYSIRDAVTVLRTEGDGSLRIDTPPVDVFLKMDIEPES